MPQFLNIEDKEDSLEKLQKIEESGKPTRYFLYAAEIKAMRDKINQIFAQLLAQTIDLTDPANSVDLGIITDPFIEVLNQKPPALFEAPVFVQYIVGDTHYLQAFIGLTGIYGAEQLQFVETDFVLVEQSDDPIETTQYIKLDGSNIGGYANLGDNMLEVEDEEEKAYIAPGLVEVYNGLSTLVEGMLSSGLSLGQIWTAGRDAINVKRIRIEPFNGIGIGTSNTGSNSPFAWIRSNDITQTEIFQLPNKGGAGGTLATKAKRIIFDLTSNIITPIKNDIGYEVTCAIDVEEYVVTNIPIADNLFVNIINAVEFDLANNAYYQARWDNRGGFLAFKRDYITELSTTDAGEFSHTIIDVELL